MTEIGGIPIADRYVARYVHLCQQARGSDAQERNARFDKQIIEELSQAEAELTKTADRKQELEVQLNAGDSWAWLRQKFERAGRNYRWFKPREWEGGKNSLKGTRYEVMGWIHCLFGEADSSRTYLEICLEQQKRADDAEAERDRQYEENAGLIAKTAELESEIDRLRALKDAATEFVKRLQLTRIEQGTRIIKPEQALQRALVFAKEEQDRREKDALPEPTPQEEELLTEIANVVDGITKALG